MKPNKITTANAAIALWFHAGRRRPGVAEFHRYPDSELDRLL